jgi:hypothetical protein
MDEQTKKLLTRARSILDEIKKNEKRSPQQDLQEMDDRFYRGYRNPINRPFDLDFQRPDNAEELMAETNKTVTERLQAMTEDDL